MFKFNLTNRHLYEKENFDYFKHLVNVANHDGFLDKLEVVSLCKIGEKLGLGTSTIQQLINNYKPYELLQLPKTAEEKFNQLYDVICIVLADDILTDIEIDFCIKLAKRLGYSDNVVGELVRLIYHDIEKGVSRDIIEKNVSNLVN